MSDEGDQRRKAVLDTTGRVEARSVAIQAADRQAPAPFFNPRCDASEETGAKRDTDDAVPKKIRSVSRSDAGERV